MTKILLRKFPKNPLKKMVLGASFFMITGLFGQQNFAIKNIPEELKANANAVIRQESFSYTIKDVDRITITESHVISILNKAGEGLAAVGIVYNPTNRVSGIKVSILDENGKEIKSYSKSDFSDVSYVQSSAIYTDDRLLYLMPTAPYYPYTIKYSYTTDSSDTGFVPNFTPFHTFNVSLEESSLIIENKSGIPLRTKVYQTDYAKATANEQAAPMRYSFSQVPAIKKEILSPSISYLLPRVEFSLEKFSLKGRLGNIQTWDDFGKWYYQDLLTPVSQVTPEIKSLVQSLSLSGSTENKIRTLYQYMQDNTRYVNVSMGIGGWQPMVADDVRKKGYGDCKALTNYMRTLLEAAGIKSYCSLIYLDDTERSFDKDFPKLGGNHMVLMVPSEKDIIWLENTSQNVAFNHLFYQTENRNALVIDEQGLKIVETPNSTAKQNKEVLSAKIQVREDAGIEGDLATSFWGGQYDRMLSLNGLRENEQIDAMKNMHPKLKFDRLKLNGVVNNRNLGENSYSIQFSAKEYAKKLGSDLFFNISPFYSSALPTQNEQRVLPFEIPFPYEDNYTIEYSLPVGFKVSELPVSGNLKSEFGSYQITFENKDNKIIVHRIININKAIYPKEKFGSYQDFRRKIENFDNTKILINKI